MRLNKSLNKNLMLIHKKFNGEKTFDLTQRKFEVSNKRLCLLFIDSFKDDILIDRAISYLMNTDPKDLTGNLLENLIKKALPVAEVEVIDNVDDMITELLAGPQILLIDGFDKAIAIDARTWQIRAPQEPELEKATRGSEDGFIETMMFNIQLIRRRIRDEKLRTEAMRVGKRAKNDVSLVYIEDIASQDLVNELKEKIESIDTDGLPLADRTVEDFITESPLNPLPKVRYTNRPDIAAAHLFEGKICILVDNSPTVLIVPAIFFDHTQNLEEYRHPPIPGTYFNLLRFIAIIFAVVLPPLWLLLALDPIWIPEMFEFIGPRDPSIISLSWQFVLASIGIDLIRIASIQTPSSLATSLSLIGALILGEFSVQVGLFDPETIFYLAIGAISNFAIPGFELSLTLGLMRFVLIILVIFFSEIGLIGGLLIFFALFVLSKSFGVPYLWPLIPFDWYSLKGYLFRRSILKSKDRKLNVPGSKDFE